MRFVLISTHTEQTTGYSKVSFNLIKQIASLAPKVKLFHFGFQKNPLRTNGPGIRKIPDVVNQYDAGANENPREEGFGFNVIKNYLEMVSPDVVMIYNDPMIIHKFIIAMEHDKAKSPFKLWIYIDQVYEGINPQLMGIIREHSDRIYCFTEQWKQTFLKYEGNENLNVSVIEHAVDSGSFSRLPSPARKTIRENMGIPEGTPVFLNINRNSQRKRLDLTIQGFVRILKENTFEKMPILLIATGATPNSGSVYDLQRVYLNELEMSGMNKNELATQMRIIDTSQQLITDEGVNQLYNASDIGINTSDGEGFGLCQLEHLYTGAPQVVTDVGSYNSFLNKDVAVFIPRGDRYYMNGVMPLGLFAYSFQVSDVAKAMKEAIDNLPTLKKNAEKFNFKSWSRICDGFLEDIIGYEKTLSSKAS
jgi:glycosyltransferase involved in cell wall biosynthesis